MPSSAISKSSARPATTSSGDFAQFASDHPDLPLAIAWRMRNAIAQGYFEVDLQTVWRTIPCDLPDVAAKVNEALQVRAPRT
jgi:uncharacterized protein with HEPN domain